MFKLLAHGECPNAEVKGLAVIGIAPRRKLTFWDMAGGRVIKGKSIVTSGQQRVRRA
ncbi:hypothetical protein [Pseudomonas plecoglossicida]|uniref:hypothetical protein n=1 Tax=Pseudomonas plecoglossicida TaxID=70775 RepID=UPI003D22F566